MSVAILSIGTEVVRGEIIDTNAAWLASRLTEAGFHVETKMAVHDEVERIAETVKQLAESHRMVVATGGLGPTTDDLTALAAARASGVETAENPDALLEVRRRVESRGRQMTAAHRKQALLPIGCDLLSNTEGTAPGFGVVVGAATCYFLPGVPKEMRRMFEDQVLPRARPQAPSDRHVIRLCTFGLPESAAASKLDGLTLPDGVVLGYRVHFPELEIKIQARGVDGASAREAASVAAASVRAALGDVVYGEGDDTLPWVVGRTLRQRGFRLALAESCTGGLVSHLLTAHAGASDFFTGAGIVYANSSKTRLLGVPEDTLRGHGAVSAETAIAMAQGVRRVCEVDVGLSLTGVAGPSGGTTTKPVGLVYWALALGDRTIVRERVFRGDRGEIQTHAAYSALDLVRRVCGELPEEVVIPVSQRAPQR